MGRQGNRLALFARAALKSRKRFGGGLLEPTHYLEVVYSRPKNGRGQMPTLKEAKMVNSFPRLRGDYNRLQTALYCIKLMNRVCQEGMVDSAGLFNLLGNTLNMLEKVDDLKRLRIHFDFRFLAEQGVLPHLAAAEKLAAIPIHKTAQIDLNDEEWKSLSHQLARLMEKYLKDFSF